MLYLEDYLEVIEHLPIDLRERFTDMREMDLQVQNNMDLLDDKAKKLFNRCSIKKVKVSGADEIYEEIKTEYYKTLEDTDQKVHLANQIYDLVDRHLRKLDQELSKFKMELEADNPGITEVLEQRSLELDNSASQQNIASHSHKERKRNINSQPNTANSSPSNMLSSVPEKKIKVEAIRSNSDPVLPKQLDQMGKENLMISDNIVPEKDQRNDFLVDLQDLNMTFPQVSNTLKSNIEIKSMNELSTDMDTMLADSLDTSGEHISDSSHGSIPGSFGHRPSRTKKQTSKAAAWVQERMQAEARQEQRKKEHQPLGLNVVETVNEVQNSRVEVLGSTVEWTCDPNEPRYCICNQVSYGEMVGCDNEQCTIEWFHYGCVGLMEAPKGKWYCPQCTQTMKRRNKK